MSANWWSWASVTSLLKVKLNLITTFLVSIALFLIAKIKLTQSSLANPGRTFKSRNSIINSGTEWMPKKSPHWSKSSHILAHSVGYHSDSLYPLTDGLVASLHRDKGKDTQVCVLSEDVCMCVGPPASTMNLPWQTETGPHALNTARDSGLSKRLSHSPLCPPPLWRDSHRKRGRIVRDEEYKWASHAYIFPLT